MKENIVLTIDNNFITFDYKTISKEEKAFLNKDSLMKNSLYYGKKYYKKNIKKICNILKTNYNIDTIIINKLITFSYTIELINNLQIKNLFLNFSSTIDISDYELFLNCSSLKTVNCYFMSSDYIKKFNQKGIIVNIRMKNKINDKFLEMQDVKDENELYYKKVISIKEEYPELLTDLEEFLKINYKLKGINIYVYSIDLIKQIVELVKNDESRNVIIYLHQETDKGNFIVNNFDWLKDLSNKCKNEYTCEFRIIYSNSFLSKNLFKQLTYNNLKLIMILCVYVSAVILLIVKSYEYIEKMSIADINTQLSEEEIDETNENIVKPEDSEQNIDNNENEIDNNIKEEEKSKYYFEKSFNKLKKINKDTVGYIVVNNTEISYPVVQYSDNSYYLIRDFYKKKATIGWIYLDYRNNLSDLNDNTIIYGHNMSNGTMFGSLKKVLDSNWRNKKENMIISLDSINKSYKFKIFSAYKVDYTTDYLVTNFDTQEEKKDFINMIKNRSKIKSDVEVGVESKILTLSTCSGISSNNKRLVVHAVLLEGEKE